MTTRSTLGTLIIALGLLGAAWMGQAADKVEPARIARLIEQMGSADFEDREKATVELGKIGLPALPSLREALKSTDPEVRRRAADLVSKMQREIESKTLLTPSKVRLTYKDTPLSEAIKDFGQKTGYQIALFDPEGKLADRTITLDTGETTFWQAFDLFVAKAGLTEATAEDYLKQPVVPGVAPPNQVPPIRVAPIKINPIRRIQIQPVPQAQPKEKPAENQPQQKPAEDQPVKKPVQRRRQAVQAQIAPAAPLPAVAPAILPVAPPQAFPQPGQITLKPGKPETLPADYSTAVRVRAQVPADQPGAKDQLSLTLEATPEPKLQWQNTLGVKIDRAMDDQGQLLEHLPGDQPVNPRNVNAAILRARRMKLVGVTPSVEFPVTLKKAAKPSAMIKELTGTIQAEVLVPAEEVTANLVKAEGKTFKGKDGASIQVIGVQEGNASYQITISLSDPMGGNLPGAGGIQILPINRALPIPPPPAPVPPNAPGLGAFQVQAPAQGRVQVQVQGAQIIIQGNGVVIGRGGLGMPTGGSSLKVLDEKGNVLQQTGMQTQLRRGAGGLERQYTIMVKAAPGQGKPTRLVYASQKSVTLDIPFSLKDIPLPK